MYDVVRERKVVYDEQDVREAGSEKARRGSSFRTKNIASFVALRRVDTLNIGVIVATTHLFWHPSYVRIILSTTLYLMPFAATRMNVQGDICEVTMIYAWLTLVQAGCYPVKRGLQLPKSGSRNSKLALYYCRRYAFISYI